MLISQNKVYKKKSVVNLKYMYRGYATKMNVHTGIENIEKKHFISREFPEFSLSNQHNVVLAQKFFNLAFSLLA